MDITIVWGDNDLFFNQKGFTRLADKLNESGNNVKTHIIKESGHMVLLDNGEDRVKNIILNKLKQD